MKQPKIPHCKKCGDTGVMAVSELPNGKLKRISCDACEKGKRRNMPREKKARQT